VIGTHPRFFVGNHEMGPFDDIGPLTPMEVDQRMDFAVQQARVIAERLQAETERWVLRAAERGSGWTAWRSDPRYEIGAVKHDFMLVPPGGGHPRGGSRFAPKTGE
jgi:hypothetical protein